MPRKFIYPKLFIGALTCLFSIRGLAEEVVSSPFELIVSVAEQRLMVLREGGVLVKYPISTSKFGLGDSFGSYKTPVGHLKICDKVGGNLASGTVLKHREATGEILPVNAAGRDPIVTRIIWLEGLDEQNRNAKARGIYIHGTTEESRIGRPVSWGCIRMRSRDVIELFDGVPVGTSVNIILGKLPKMRKYVPLPPILLAKNTPAEKGVPEAAAGKVERRMQLASNNKPANVERLSEISSGPAMVPADPGAAQAMRGSILSAGLPDGAAQKTGSQKHDSMKFQSWSSVSLRDADSKEKMTGLR